MGSTRGMASSESASSDEHGAPTEERNLTLDERVLRGKSEHTCLKRLDELMYCLTPTNQFAKYYSEGTYDYCPARFTAWHVCLKTKLSKPERAQEIQQEEWARTVPRTHLWAFRPEYEAEAYERYGLRPAPPSAHPEARNDAVPFQSR